MRVHLFSLLLAVASMIGSGGSPSEGQVDARVTGVVIDSITGKPLPNAVVQLVGRTDRNRSVTTRTDAEGRFAFDSVAPGPYIAGFLHPRLDSLYITAPLREGTLPRAACRDFGSSCRRDVRS